MGAPVLKGDRDFVGIAFHAGERTWSVVAFMADLDGLAERKVHSLQVEQSESGLAERFGSPG